MSTPIGKWIAEHRNFERLLEVMEQQLDLFHRGEHPNYELMLDIVYYMTHYPDCFHHPHEDIAFAQMAKYGAVAAVDQSNHQHRVIAKAGKALQAQLDAVVTGVMLPWAQVEEPARSYVEYFRRHMRREEHTLFPLARELLTDADWAAIDAQLPKAVDPLLGGNVEKRYRMLQLQIANEVGCDCAIV